MPRNTFSCIGVCAAATAAIKQPTRTRKSSEFNCIAVTHERIDETKKYASHNFKGMKLFSVGIRNCHRTVLTFIYLGLLDSITGWFLLGAGRMPHPVGGAVGVTLSRADSSRWLCMTVVL